MRKGATTSVEVVLILLITLSLIVMSYSWLLKYSSWTQTEVEKSLPQKEGCLNIESIDTSNKKITLRNCGDVDLSNFLVYVDDKPIANYSQKLVAGSIIQIDYVEDIEFGEHDVQVSSDYAETPYIRFNYKKPRPSCEWPSNGDWFVDKEILCEDKIITLNGNLNVSNTGNLTFKDVTLKINGTFDDQYNIYVNGGKFYILDKDNNPSTVNDRSIITNGSANKRYNITVYPNSVFQIKNSKVYRTDKINIYASNSIVSGNYINDSNKIYFNSSSQLLDNNYIENHGGINFGYPDNAVITNNIIIKMNNSPSEYDGGITFTGPSGSQFSNVTIANNIINETYCSGVYFSVDFNNLTFYNNTVKKAFANLIPAIGEGCDALRGGYFYNVNISNNFISNYTDSINFNYIENASIANNFFGNNFRGGNKHYPDGIEINWIVNVEIRNNTITNVAQNGIKIYGNNITIANNTISECAYNALYIYGNNTKILNNTIKYNRLQPECSSYPNPQCCPASPCGYGIYLAGADNINLTIKYNDINNNYASGIYATGIANEGNILISDNKITNNTDYGIIISTTEPVSGEISRNDIKNNTVGTEFDNFYNVWFNDNVVKFNTNNGVYCYNSGPLFKNNSIINNGDDTDACFMSVPPSTWWNYGWLFRRNVSIDEKIGISRINDPIILNSTEYVMLDANCDNKAYNTTIRVIYNEITEIPFSLYNVSYCPTTGFVKGLKLAFKVNVSQNALGDKSYKIYYTNNTSISKSSFLLKQKPIMILWQQSGAAATQNSYPPNSTAIKSYLNNAGYGDIFNDSNTAGAVSVLAYPGFINYTTIMYFQGSKMTYAGCYTYFNTTAMRLSEYQRRGLNIFIEGDDTGYDWCYYVKQNSYSCTGILVDGSTFNGTFRNLTHADNEFYDQSSIPPTVVNVTLLYNHPTTKYIGAVGTKFNSTAPYLDTWFSNVGLNSYSIMNNDLDAGHPFIGFSYFGQNDTSCDAYSGYQCKYAVYYSGVLIDTNGKGINISAVRQNFLKGIIGWFYGEDTLNISTDPEELWAWNRP